MAFFAGGVALLFTLAWLGVQFYFAFRYAQSEGETDRRALIAWGLSFAGGFTGPCVILLSLVALGVGLWARHAAEEPSARTRIASHASIAASSVILVMAMLMVLLLGVGQLLSGS